MTCLARGITRNIRKTEHFMSFTILRRSIVLSSCCLGTVKTRSYKLNASCHPIAAVHSVYGLQGKRSSSLKTFETNIDLAKNIQEITTLLKDYGINESDITDSLEVFNLPPGVVEHRIQYCSEAGLRRHIDCITKFEELIKCSISLLKSTGVISQDTIVPHEMLSKVNYDGTFPSFPNENLPVQDIHFQTVCHYLTNTFDFKYPNWKKFRVASLKFSIENLNTLMELGLNLKWIRKHPSLLCNANPTNLKKLSDLDAFVLPINVCQLIQKEPRVAFVNADDVKAIFFILMKHQVCKHDLLEVEYEHFLMNPDFVNLQFKKLKETAPPQNTNHLSLLYKLKYLGFRNKLSEVKLPGQMLPRDELYYNIKFSNEEESWRNEMKTWSESNDSSNLEYKPCYHNGFSKDMKRTGKLPMYLADIFSLTPTQARIALSEIAFWKNVKVESVQEIIDFLLEEGYEEEDILKSIQLLVFPRHIVADTLTQNVKSDPVYGSKEFKHRHLQLCLYYILMQNNYCLSWARKSKRKR